MTETASERVATMNIALFGIEPWERDIFREHED
jgi:hypothetical protein